jgi:predicted ATP-grasp superfamily ATP-dependent carboligase
MTGRHAADRRASLAAPGGLRPAIVLGGSTNALSVVRSLGRRGVPVAASVSAGSPALYSRFCVHRLPLDRGDQITQWADLLLGRRAGEFAGAVLLACNDDAVEFIATHRDRLAPDYVLDDSAPAVQLAMLDKQRTLEIGCRAGIGVPRFWPVGGGADVDPVFDGITYPAIVKPLHSHKFQKVFDGRKFFRAANRVELEDALARLVAAGLEAMVSEWVPGPDSRLASYYTYIDRDGRPLFHFTKRIIRRFPKNQGLACYHVTAWDPTIAEHGLRFLEGIGLRGLANVEFKLDERDGRWKLIECNPRFTAAQEILVRAGLDIAWLIYCHLGGYALPSFGRYTEGVRLWYPVRDFRAYRELRRLNELTLWTWLRSVWHPQALPYFRLTDPLPSAALHWSAIRSTLGQ